MKNIKRLAALLLVVIMAFSVAGCHKKDEIAVTIGDVEFTSAYYMCALINANMEAKGKVDEALTEDEKEQGTEVDYFSKKIDKKDFTTWVKDRAIETLKKIAAYKILCKENKIELDKEKLNNAETNASFYWSSYGYSMYFEPNGVGENTYKTYATDSLYAERYFEFLFDANGEKAINADDVKTKIYDNFVIADILEASYEENATDKDKTDLKAKFDKYAEELKTGKKTFEQVYNEHNKVEEETTEPESETEEDTAKDKYAQVIGSDDTNYSSTYYEKVKDMKVGEIKVEENEGKTGVLLFFKQDITADPFYLKDLDMDARHLIADKDYEKIIEDYIKKLNPEINNYAVNQFKVKKIEEPSYG